MSKLPFDPVDAGEVYNANDFKSLTLDVYFKNLQSDTTYNQDVELVETGDQTITFALPPKSCGMKQSVMVDIFKNKKTSRNKPCLAFTGKISKTEIMEDGRIRATVKLVQYEEKEWEAFLALFSKRQDEINNFFESLKH